MFRQLGSGYTLVGNQYKYTLGTKDYYIDLLLYNIELNCYVVIDLKIRELRKEDKEQIKFYMEYIDKHLKKSSQNKTLGIIISKEQDKYIATFVSEEDIIPIT